MKNKYIFTAEEQRKEITHPSHFRIIEWEMTQKSWKSTHHYEMKKLG